MVCSSTFVPAVFLLSIYAAVCEITIQISWFVYSESMLSMFVFGYNSSVLEKAITRALLNVNFFVGYFQLILFYLLFMKITYSFLFMRK